MAAFETPAATPGRVGGVPPVAARVRPPRGPARLPPLAGSGEYATRATTTANTPVRGVPRGARTRRPGPTRRDSESFVLIVKSGRSTDRCCWLSGRQSPGRVGPGRRVVRSTAKSKDATSRECSRIHEQKASKPIPPSHVAAVRIKSGMRAVIASRHQYKQKRVAGVDRIVTNQPDKADLR